MCLQSNLYDRSRSPSPRREKSRRRSRSRSRSRSRDRKGLADMSYEQYLEAFEKVLAHALLCADASVAHFKLGCAIMQACMWVSLVLSTFVVC